MSSQTAINALRIDREQDGDGLACPVNVLKAEIDEDAWSSLYSTESRTFPKPTSGKIAVKVINDYGDDRGGGLAETGTS